MLGGSARLATMERSIRDQPGGRRRPPILVIGAHRSGTTATARALRLLGLQIGQRLDSHEESRELQQLHERYLRQVGAAWYRPHAFIERVKTSKHRKDCAEYLRASVDREFASIFGYRKNLGGLFRLARLRMGGLWGWKEPRTTLFAPAWLDVFPDARIVHVIRHPLAAAMSIRQRELEFRDRGDPAKQELDDLDFCLRLVAAYIRCGEDVALQTPHYYKVHFEEIQTHPREALARLADFCSLRFTPAQLATAAGTIRPPTSPSRRGLAGKDVNELVTEHSIVTRLGYAWDLS
ncbi:MAG: hypothetical protein QOI34_574 [Verrucomicrobiota bacterium]